ncbi:Flagellar biosynthesis protein FliS [Planococcus halocryophilus Or1]|uniref:Flagellar export chaperone FliS n=1 Tax=Planococcus halocryophilus TaxID=1215089 RepID=A0A1C7DTG7_9BACL|nr:flagellar export chaperone FliS [Planococcus halocryophilus]ANU14806.1 flagellar export chaperone FliS [Planococcus halocryophilus]EMF45178.1 Flagellar biosynthesis protein FliS [Planococcus halocryophilus Or1]
MVTINPYQTYQQNSVMTASPQELTLMLYNGCLKFMKLAKRAMADKKIEEKNTNIIKAQNIIQELRSTLKADIEMSAGLEQMYEYMYNRLVEANMKNDVTALEEVEALMTDIRNTWKQAMALVKK